MIYLVKNISFLQKLVSSILVFILCAAAFSQSINFKHYGISEGLIHPTVYTITQDRNGFVWLGTGAGVCRFDGIKFSVPSSPDSLTKSYGNVSFCDNDGNAWFGYDDGSVFCYKQRKLRKIFSNTSNPSVVTAFTQDQEGGIIVTTQNSGFYIITDNTTKQVIKGTEGRLYYSVAALTENKYLVGTNDGLWIFTVNKNTLTAAIETKINEIPSTKIQCIIKASTAGSFWIGTEDAGFYLLKTGAGKFVVNNIGEKNNLGASNVQWVLEDNTKNLWVCTFGNGMHKLLYNAEKLIYETAQVYNQNNGLADNYIKIAYQDKEGNIWIGTYSNGLAGIIDEAFVFYNFKNESFDNDILAVVADKDEFWTGSRKALVKIDRKNTNNKQIFSERNGLPSDNITSLTLDNATLWIGTEKSGIYKMDTKSGQISKFFSSSNSIENKINAIELKNQILWVATNGGVFKFNLKTGKHDHYSTDTNLPHNKINDIFVDSQGIVWIATKNNGLFSLNSDKHFKIDGNSELEFTSITEDKHGNIWATTYGDGIFEFHKDSLRYISEKNGLKSDYCYSAITDDEGNIWVGHRLGISKINPNTMSVMAYGPEIGITGDCNSNAIAIDPLGTLRFGTTNGLIQYNYQKNRSKLSAPQLNLISVKIADKEIDFNDKIELSYGKYKMRFDFVGLNFRAPLSVKYQYKLDGWESEWSELSSASFANYTRVDDGRFKFLVRAVNAEGICSEPLEVSIYVHPPLWKRWWFIILCVAAVVGFLYFYIKYRERKQIQFQQYLQKLLDERTREVVEQKEVIELKNRDITDSITYAQRIQSSILPSVKKLQDNFAGCFIFYQPRDIVSGDFYWFDKITDSKFVIVCGDSTGHGVPGALMSMIGTTLIKDICNRPDVVSPSKILEKLDEEILLTLNQNNDAEKSTDGMDLIACEIDSETYVVKIASAMRPVILYQDGEQVYVQGSTNSIGGNEMMGEIKIFNDQVYQLKKGDLIYMFSDGYPDQFGGPMGKKFKLVRLRNLIKDIHELPMEEQYHHVKNTFNLWRDQNEQVDDVLFMGIRI